MSWAKEAEWLITPGGLLVVGAAMAIAPFYFRRHFDKDIPRGIVLSMLLGGFLLIGFGLYRFSSPKQGSADDVLPDSIVPVVSARTRQFEFLYSTIDLALRSKTNPKGVIDATMQIDIKNLTSNKLRVAVVDLPTSNSYATLQIDGIGTLSTRQFSGIMGQHISFPQRVQVDCPDMAANFTSIDPDESQRVMMEFEGNLRGRDMGSPKAGSISAQLLVLDTKTKECLLKGFPSPAARIPVSVQAQ